MLKILHLVKIYLILLCNPNEGLKLVFTNMDYFVRKTKSLKKIARKKISAKFMFHKINL